MEQYWQVLGLDEPPTDMKSAKRAYAAKLKATRPDDDPDGFMKLREALEEAKYILEDRPQVLPIIVPSPTQPVIQDFIHEPEAEDREPELEIHEAEVEAVPQFQNQIAKLLDSPKDRNDQQIWTNFIQSIGRESSLDEYAAFNTQLREAFLERLGFNDGDGSKRNFATDMPFIESPVAAEIFRLMDWTEPQDHGYFIGQELEWLLQDFRLIKLNRVSERQQSAEVNALFNNRNLRYENAYKNSNYAIVEKFMICGVIGIIILVALFSSS